MYKSRLLSLQKPKLTHKNCVGKLSLEIMFSERIFDLFENSDISKTDCYFTHENRCDALDEIINSCITHSKSERIASFLCTHYSHDMVESYTRNPKEFMEHIDNVTKNIIFVSLITSSPEYTGDEESFLKLAEKYSSI